MPVLRATLFLLCASLQPCLAGARHFTFLYEAPTAAPGSFELENYATSVFDSRFSGLDFRHELEIGLTPRLQASVYFANWSYDRPQRRFSYNGASLEFIYNLASPVGDPVGISVYQEIGGGRRAFESETKLIAQKNFGPVILLYNVTLEAEWEGEGLGERNGEVQQALGASYEFSPRFSVGVEMLHEISLTDWQTSDTETNFFLGPNVTYRSNNWFVALTALKQLTRTTDEPHCAIRLIVGVSL